MCVKSASQAFTRTATILWSRHATNVHVIGYLLRLEPSTAPFVLRANSATIELNAWGAPLATIKRITSLTPTAPSVLSVATSPTKSRVIASIAKKGSIKTKKPSNFVFLVILGSTRLQPRVQTAMHAKRDDTSQERGTLVV